MLSCEPNVVEIAKGIVDADGERAQVDFAEGSLADDDDRHRWVKLHDILYPRLNVADEVAVDGVR